MNDNETFEFENRTYINPDVSRDEQTAFIDTLRGLQDEKNAQIATETHNLGTDVEPHLGGLSGSEDYWKAKYQTPQTNAMIADMKAAAQQSALNNAMSNYSNMLQERYNQAYRNYNKRAYNHNRSLEKSSGSGGGAAPDPNADAKEPDVTYSDGSTEANINDLLKIEGLAKNWVDNETRRLMKEEGLDVITARKKAKESSPYRLKSSQSDVSSNVKKANEIIKKVVEKATSGK